jgi:hypothetical protein
MGSAASIPSVLSDGTQAELGNLPQEIKDELDELGLQGTEQSIAYLITLTFITSFSRTLTTSALNEIPIHILQTH